MSMNEPCPLCKQMIPISDVINNSCPHCGSKPPDVKSQQERQALAREDAVLITNVSTEHPSPVTPVEPKETDHEILVKLRGEVIKLGNMVNGASVERLKMNGEIKSLRQEVQTLQERVEQVETPFIEDWSALVAEKGYATEKAMLDDMYNNKKMSMRKMADELGTSKFTVQKRMDKQGLERRKPGVNKK